MTNNQSNIIQLLIAGIVVLAGIALLFVGISYDPKGEIHETVLVAFGEAATFAGSIMGIDYHYKKRYYNANHSTHKNEPEGQSGAGQNARPAVESTYLPQA